MVKYLFRLLSYDEIKSNSIKNVDGMEFSVESYVKRNSSHNNSAISMTASLEYLLGHGLNDKSIDINNRKVAIIDTSKLNRKFIVDIHTVCKYIDEIQLSSYKFPPDTEERDTSHYSARAVEFLYYDNIPKNAYRIYDFSELIGYLQLTYNNPKMNFDGYPYVFNDKPSFIYGLGNLLRYKNIRSYLHNLNSGNTRLDANWLYDHSVYCLGLGIYSNFEEFYYSIYGKNIMDNYSPCGKEVVLLSEIYDKVTNTSSYKIREQYNKNLEALFENKLSIPYTDMFNNVYLNVKDVFNFRFKK